MSAMRKHHETCPNFSKYMKEKQYIQEEMP